jgi:hypothetical protein
MVQWWYLLATGPEMGDSESILMADETSQPTEKRQREIIERITSDEALVAQYRASRASFERGELAIPGEHVRAEAKARRQRA